jgi:hypothetical protein
MIWKVESLYIVYEALDFPYAMTIKTSPSKVVAWGQEKEYSGRSCKRRYRKELDSYNLTIEVAFKLGKKRY